LSLRALSSAAVVTLTGAFALVFFYAPNDADQGFIQKIFYIHVPMAMVALGGFVAGGVCAIQHLRTRRSEWDLRSYVFIHLSLILGVGVLITGSIWARASWGHWWVWDEPTLVSFLIIFLLYCCYQPLRFSIEDPDRQARYAAVFAIIAGAFVPLNFLAVRLAQSVVHPRVLGATGGSMPGSMRLTFLVALAGMILLFACYQPLRFSIEDPERQARYASVFAVTAAAFVPVNFLAVRLASAVVHPRVFATADGVLPPRMKVAFYVCFLGIALLYATLWKYEMAAKNARMQTRALRRLILGEEHLKPLKRSAAPS